MVSSLAGGVLWPLLAAGLGLAAAYAFWSRRRDAALVRKAQAESADLRAALDRVELLLLAEPQILLLWQSQDTSGGNEAILSARPVETFVHPHLRTSCLPEENEATDFDAWLEAESAAELRRRLTLLAEGGEAFNVSLRTATGELIEADGRVAGRHLALRFRPLFGERLQALEQSHDIKRLKDHARRITSLLAGAPVPVWITDSEGRLQWANESWLELVGAPSLEAAKAEELSLLGRGELAAAGLLEERGGWQRLLASTVLGEERRHFEVFQREHEAGVVHWALDVSDRERLKEELERRRMAQNRIFDQLHTAIAIFDADRRLAFHNAAYARLWELDESWLARRPHEEEILNRIYDAGMLDLAEDFPAWRRRWLDMHAEGRTRRERWQLANGHVVEVIAEPQPGEGVIYMFEDITEQMRLEARYRELSQVQEETLDHLHEALAVFGTDGRLRLFNPMFADLWNMDENRLKVRPHVDDIITECRDKVRETHFWDDLKLAVTGAMEARRGLSGRLNMADGRVFDYLLVPLPDGNTLITWHEMTDAVRAERAAQERAAALEESDRVKTAFLDSISYDMRTPLTTINGFTEMLVDYEMAGPLNPKQREYLLDVREASDELLDRIDTALDLVAIDAGKLTLDIVEFEVLPMLEEVARGLARKLARRDMALEIELAEDAQVMRGDRRRIAQALRHLLINAIGFSPRGGTIRLGARRDEDGSVSFWVADEGPGMNREMMQRAFERFFAKPSPEGHRGPGLGLPLVKALIELHGGNVELHSREGRGTTVICRLPQRQSQERLVLREQA